MQKDFNLVLTPDVFADLVSGLKEIELLLTHGGHDEVEEAHESACSRCEDILDAIECDLARNLDYGPLFASAKARAKARVAHRLKEEA